jgi:5-methylcytosine-specific restriction protein B
MECEAAHTGGYIATDGRLHLRSRSYWDSMPEDLSTIANPVTDDQIIFGIWPPAAFREAQPLGASAVIKSNLVGREKVHEIRIWDEAGAVGAGMRRMPSSIPIEEIVQWTEAQWMQAARPAF